MSAVTTPRVEALEVQLQKALDRLEGFENQSSNLRIVGLKEGTEGKKPVSFFERWIPGFLNMGCDRVKLERVHCTGPQKIPAGKEGSRAVLVRLHDYTDKQKILQVARKLLVEAHLTSQAAMSQFTRISPWKW